MFYCTLPSHKTSLQPSSREDSPPTAGFSEFRASSPETREREREADAGEAPTQGVMVHLSCTTLMTLEHTWYDNHYPLVPPRRFGATLRGIPELGGALSNLSSAADTGARRG